jgi:hypothetical protein
MVPESNGYSVRENQLRCYGVAVMMPESNDRGVKRLTLMVLKSNGNKVGEILHQIVVHTRHRHHHHHCHYSWRAL